MPIEKPREGHCDAQHANGTYCGNIPVPGATRCLVHGGPLQSLAGLKESLYSKRLRQTFKQPEDQRLFEEMPKTTNLDEEIRIARMQVVRYQTMLEAGEDFIFSTKPSKPLATQIANDGQANIDEPNCKALSVHDLHTAAIDSLRRLVHTQDQIHPGSDIGGNFRLTIKLQGSGKPRAPIPDLTGDKETSHLLPAVARAADSVVDAEPDPSGTGYDGDD